MKNILLIILISLENSLAHEEDLAPQQKGLTTLQYQYAKEIEDQKGQAIVERSSLPDLRPSFESNKAIKYFDERNCTAKILVENWGSVEAPASKVKIKWQTLSTGEIIELIAHVGAVAAHDGQNPGVAYSEPIAQLRLFSDQPQTRFFITVDAFNTVSEGGPNGETNNEKLFQWNDSLFPKACVPRRPDLIVPYAEWKDNCDLEVKVTNQGTVATSPFSSDSFFTQIDGVTLAIAPQGGNTQTSVLKQIVGPINAGATKTFTLSGYRPINNVPMTKITADKNPGSPSYGSIFETDIYETNNELQIVPKQQCLVPPPGPQITEICAGFWATYHRKSDAREFLAHLSWGGEILQLFDLGINNDGPSVSIFENKIYINQAEPISNVDGLYEFDPITSTKTFKGALLNRVNLGSTNAGLLRSINNYESFISVLNPDPFNITQQITVPFGLKFNDMTDSKTEISHAVTTFFDGVNTFYNAIHKINTTNGTVELVAPSATASFNTSFDGVLKIGTNFLASAQGHFFIINPNTYEVMDAFELEGAIIHDLASCSNVLP
jgi:hypothetical protein